MLNYNILLYIYIYIYGFETIDDISRWYWSTNPDDINATLTLDVYNYYNNL